MVRKRSVPEKNIGFDVITIDEAKVIVIRNKKMEGSRAETKRNYRKFFRHLEIFLIENKIENLKDLTEQDAKSFMYHLINRGLQSVTINSYLNNAKGSFKILKEDGLCNHTFENTKYLKTDEKKIGFLTVDEIDGFLKGMNLSKYTEIFLQLCNFISFYDVYYYKAIQNNKEKLTYYAYTLIFYKAHIPIFLRIH